MHTQLLPHTLPLAPPLGDLGAEASSTLEEQARIFGLDTLTHPQLLELLVAGLVRSPEGAQRAWAGLSTLPWARLMAASIPELMEHGTLTSEQATALGAALCLAQRWTWPVVRPGARVQTAADVASLMAPRLAHLERERMMALLLDARHGLLRVVWVSEGWREGTTVDPREVFRPALAERASALILVHNHPSGDATPSRQDVELTRRLKRCADDLGLRLLDHVVVTVHGHRSAMT